MIPALALSLLLHLVLLWPGTTSRNAGEAVPLLVAHLRAASAPPALPRREPSRALPSPNQPSPLAAPVAQAPATPDSTPALPLRSESVAPAAPDIGAGAAPPAAVAVMRGDGLDAEGVRRYRLALAVEAGRFKRYPARAKEANMTGTVEIRVAVATTGLAGEIELAKSSGYELLDDAALDMMRKAATRAMVPELLRNRTFVVSLPVVFDLTSE